MEHIMEIFIATAENGQKGWMLKDNDPEVRELFGTDILPLPWTAEAPASIVLDSIQQANQDATVTIRRQP